MKDLKDIIDDDKAFEDLFVQVMHKVGHERDKQRIEFIREMSEEQFRQIIGAHSAKVVPL